MSFAIYKLHKKNYFLAYFFKKKLERIDRYLMKIKNSVLQKWFYGTSININKSGDWALLIRRKILMLIS